MIFGQTSKLFLLLFKKEPYGKKSSFKYFINDNDNRPLCIKPPRMIGYVKYFESNNSMSFKLIDKKLIKKCIEIWKK